MPYGNPQPYIANSNRLAKFDLNLSIISENIEWISFLLNNQGQRSVTLPKTDEKKCHVAIPSQVLLTTICMQNT